MAENRVLEARERRSRRARRRRGPLGEEGCRKLSKDAETWMGRAVSLRNSDVQKAMRAAERAFGFFLSASRKAESEMKRAELLVGA
ncbi:MAG TPA: hypothetical protein PKJ97_01990, partial [Candidatus Bilamarchaeaceae archaeon]|nr:hypothetical protein [Candidatus Bilamarchaeaceae archaeon]